MSDDQFWRSCPPAKDLMSVFAAHGHYSYRIETDTEEGIDVWRDHFRYVYRGIHVEVERAIPVQKKADGLMPPPITKSACVWEAVHKFLVLFALQQI